MPARSVAIITTSVRKPRVGPAVAKVVEAALADEAKKHDITLHQVDVAEFKLPVYDETALLPAMVPSRGNFANEHSIKWSAEIAKYDAYILVNPEYNYGVPASTKNAMDYLMNEWKGKPLAVVSYGINGGNMSSKSAAEMLGMMGLRVAETKPLLPFHGGAGADLFQAISSGDLGEDTKKDWEGKPSEDLRKAFGEVVKLLDEPVKVEGVGENKEAAEKKE